MRKLRLTAIAALFSLTAGFTAFAADAVTAKITAVTGKVQTQKKGSSDWADAKVGDILDEGTIIATGFNSNATLNIEGSICTLQPLTRLSLEQLAQKEVAGTDKTVTKTAVYIDTGKATFKVNSNAKKLNDFKVHSPASTASVRGTEFTVYANGTVETGEGLVAVSSGGSRASFNTPAKREQYFISNDKKISVFTATYNVGGTEDGIPVRAGEKIYIDPNTGTHKEPLVREMEDATNIGSSTITLASIEGEYGATAVPFTSSASREEEDKTSDGLSSGSGFDVSAPTSTTGILQIGTGFDAPSATEGSVDLRFDLE